MAVILEARSSSGRCEHTWAGRSSPRKIFVGGTRRQSRLRANVKKISKHGDRAGVKNENRSESGVRASMKKSTKRARERGQNQSGLRVSLNVTVKLDQKTSGEKKSGEGVRSVRDQSGQNQRGETENNQSRLLRICRRHQRWMTMWTGFSSTFLRRAWHLYLTLQGIILSGVEGPSLNPWLWIIFGIGLIGTPMYLWRVVKVGKKAQLVVSTAAFGVWVFALGGAFASLSWYEPFIGSLALVVFTFFAPLISPDTLGSEQT
jgi:hypothetical protein